MELPERAQNLQDLKERIRVAFPAGVFRGKITNDDGKWSPEQDDDQILYEDVHGRSWTELTFDVLDRNVSALPLLTEEAYVAYLPAWLAWSLEGGDDENLVREFLVYEFTSDPESPLDHTKSTVERLRLLNEEQRMIIRSILEDCAANDRSSFLRDLAAKAVGLIDSLKS